MRFGRALRWRSRLWPRTVRLRLALLYAGLFLVSGAVLLALTYGLVAASLSTRGHAAPTSAQLLRLKSACTASGGAAVPKGKQGLVPVKVPEACQKLEGAGAAAATARQRTRVLGDLLTFSLLGLGALTVCSGGLGWLVAGRVLRPVAAITGAARRASERHLGERLNLTGTADELKELADTFDGMLERLDTAFASQKRFVADASHELRTPVTRMRTSVDVALAKRTRSPESLEAMAAKVRQAVIRAESLIDALLVLAVSDRELAVQEHADLATAAEDALDAVARDVASKGITVTADLREAWATGDRVLLERLAANLVDNAVRHNDGGGWMRVATGTIPGGEAYLAVSNGGAVVPHELVGSLFEPFRTAEGRSGNAGGFGLGLAIVKSIASAHGAALQARARPEGGFDVTVAFRAAPSVPPLAGEEPAPSGLPSHEDQTGALLPP